MPPRKLILLALLPESQYFKNYMRREFQILSHPPYPYPPFWAPKQINALNLLLPVPAHHLALAPP